MVICVLLLMLVSKSTSCVIENRTDLDTHLTDYFSDPSAAHACGDIGTWDV